MIATIADNLLHPALFLAAAGPFLSGTGKFLAGAGLFLRQVLPLLSDRMNDRAVRLVKAKKKSK